jgi:acyl carrier protein
MTSAAKSGKCCVPVRDAEDDFFDSGGDSMSAIRIVGRVNRAFGITLSLHAFLEAPTIASLAALLSERISSSA